MRPPIKPAMAHALARSLPNESSGCALGGSMVVAPHKISDEISHEMSYAHDIFYRASDEHTHYLHFSISPPTCRDATPNAASPLFPANLAGTLTTSTTYPSTFRPTSPSTCLTPSRPSPRLSTSPST
ncbi:unnamed protein product, partial [Laminaria digitata]